MKTPTVAELQEYLAEVERELNTTQNRLWELEQLRTQAKEELAAAFVKEMPEQDKTQ